MELTELLEIKEDGGKYSKLRVLYNKWQQRTMFLSTGLFDNTEWEDLVEYCKENKTETAHFFLDLIDAHNKCWKDGQIGSGFVGQFVHAIYECFGDDDQFPKFSGYVPSDFAQKMYKGYVEWYLAGKPNENWFDKIINKIGL